MLCIRRRGGQRCALDQLHADHHGIAQRRIRLVHALDQLVCRLPAHGHAVIWCDHAEGSRALHAPFKLAAEGGCVIITAADDSWQDILYYPPHTGRETVARFPDGADETAVTNIPTIGTANRRSSYLTTVNQQTVDIHDEPAALLADLTLERIGGELVATSSTALTARLQLFATDGRCVHEVSLRFSGARAVAPCPTLPTGLYVARVIDDQGRSATIKLKN